MGIDRIPGFDNIPCEIAGWCKRGDLEEVTSIPGLTFDNGVRYVRKSGLLRRSSADWKEFVRLL